MARILAISSSVVSGTVGLSIILPALQRLGHEVLALPTILLSNHPGRQPAAGTRIEAPVLARILEQLHTNGLLGSVDAVLSGYLPSPAHVAVVARALDLCRAADSHPLFLCDPVLGDDPKGLYIDAAAAAAIRDTLLPRADVLTPNRFELAWLSDMPVTDAPSAIAAARSLRRQAVFATSIPHAGNRLDTLAISEIAVTATSVAMRDTAANGTGDLLSALVLSALLRDRADLGGALRFAVGGVDQVLGESPSADALSLAELPQLAPRGVASPAVHR